jgi:hypothetical protein
MMGQNGMNVGGISALFNYILIDSAAGKLGLRSKTSPVAREDGICSFGGQRRKAPCPPRLIRCSMMGTLPPFAR